MAHTHSATFFHCVFSTKERVNSIPDNLRSKLWEYIGGIAKQKGMRSIRVGGIANHVHIALHVPASMNVAKAMQLIKAGSSKWLNEHPISTRFEWQEGYGAFSIGVAQIEPTVAYIDRQVEHHQKRTFEEEYLSFLKRHGIEYDQRYVLG